MDVDLARRLELEKYALAGEYQYTPQEVDELVGFADTQLILRIRWFHALDKGATLTGSHVGGTRMWVRWEAEALVWQAIAPEGVEYPKYMLRFPSWWGGIRSFVKEKLREGMAHNARIGGKYDKHTWNLEPFRHEILANNSMTQGGASSSADIAKAGNSQLSESVFKAPPPLHGAIFPKEVEVLLRGPNREHCLEPVRKNFLCGIAGKQGEKGLKLWAYPLQKDEPVHPGVIACGVFLKAFEREIIYRTVLKKSSPRIDIFLKFYLSEEYRGVEEHIKAAFRELNVQDREKIQVGNAPEGPADTSANNVEE